MTDHPHPPLSDPLTPAEAAEARRVLIRHHEYISTDCEDVEHENAALVARVRVLEEALDIAGRDFVAGHIHIAERLNESNYAWLMHHLEAAFGRVCDARAALRATTPDAKE